MSRRTILMLRASFNPHTGFSKHMLKTYVNSKDRKIIVTNDLACTDRERLDLEAQGFEFLVQANEEELCDLKPDYVEVHGGLLTVFTYRNYKRLFREFPCVVFIHSSKFRLSDLRYLKWSDIFLETKYTFDGAFLFNALLPMPLFAALLRRTAGRKILVMMASSKQVKRYGDLFSAKGISLVYTPSGASPSAQKTPSKSKQITVVSYSRAQRVRGLDVLIDAHAFLPKSYRTNLYLLPDVASNFLSKQATSINGLTLEIGKANLDKVQSSATVFVFLTRSLRVIPFQPLTVIEALNTGKPVVASDIPPHRELAIHYSNLTLVSDYKSAKSVALAITKVATTESRSDFHNTVEQSKIYSWKTIALQQQSTIDSFLDL